MNSLVISIVHTGSPLKTNVMRRSLKQNSCLSACCSRKRGLFSTMASTDFNSKTKVLKIFHCLALFTNIGREMVMKILYLHVHMDIFTFLMLCYPCIQITDLLHDSGFPSVRILCLSMNLSYNKRPCQSLRFPTLDFLMCELMQCG